MDELRGNNPITIKTNKEFKFQIIEWVNTNENPIVEDSSEEETEKKKFIDNKEYVIRVYGVSSKGESVSLKINKFPPHFYINIPDTWTKTHITRFINFLKSERGLKNYYKNSLTKWDIKIRKKFWGFTNNKTFKFLRLIFSNGRAMSNCIRILEKKISIPGLHNQERKYDIYESNIQPFIRFIHINNINPSGWIVLETNKYNVNLNKMSRCQIDLEVDWENVKMFDSNEMTPFLVASFDIEADSSHGDFPLAKKKYKKLANDLLGRHEKLINDIHKFRNTNKSLYSELKSHLDNRETFIKERINEAFIDKPNNHNINYVYTKKNRKPNDKNITSVAEEINKEIDKVESYKGLSYEIIKFFEFEILDDDELTWLGIDNHELIKEIIDDAFYDEIYIREKKKDKEKSNQEVRTIYTKNNTKPSESCINKISKKTILLYKKIVKQLSSIIQEDKFNTIVNIFKFYLDSHDTEYNIRETEFNIKFKCDYKEVISLIDITISSIYSLLEENLPEIDNSRDSRIKRMTDTLTKHLPEVEGDKVIQIGTTIQKFGEKDCFLKHIITLDGCNPIPGAIVESYKTEKEVLLAWTKFIQLLDPDIITGYNIFGFDFAYMYHRAEELGCEEQFTQLGRFINEKKDDESITIKLTEKKLASSALGDNTLRYIPMMGRVEMDLLKVIQRDHNLVSYKLDLVAENFINDKVVSIHPSNNNKIKIEGIININIGNFITFNQNNSVYMEGKKFKIINKDEEYIEIDNIFDNVENMKWQLAKDDVSPQQIFKYQKESDKERKIIAVYCIQDCKLCLDIINKLDIITNNIGMSNVCSVPLSYIFLRGQGVKIFSLVSKQCRKEKFLIPLIKCENEEKKVWGTKYDYGEDEDEDIIFGGDDGYEGAIVLKPHPGIYLKEPVAVLDYASLYPSSMISENLSHDTIILDDEWRGDEGAKRLEELGYEYEDITHDVFSWIDPKVKNKGKRKTGTKTCRFVQFPNEEKGVIPRILQHLLKARKTTRAKIKTESNAFKCSVLDGLQLAYKITANSLYGQIGARTSPIYLKDIAASTTATGRRLLHLAKDKVQIHIPGTDIVYGDTDSIFVNFNPKDDEGIKLEGKKALEKTIELGIKFEKEFCQYLKKPHYLEYEKTFWPFVLLSKKRYVGNKYETDINKYKRTSMGIVLKRRDNAEIVKYVYGGIIDIIMEEMDINKPIEFLKKSLKDLLDGKFGLDMLVITKSLKGYYKNPESIAHKVLADRMGERDPGNKPSSNDRIPYAYIEVKEKKGSKILQGDRIEHPKFISENNLKPDYKFYISNQIKKPVSQIYGLIVENLEGFNKGEDYFDKKFKTYKKQYTHEKAVAKLADLKNAEAANLLFGDIQRIAENRKNKSREITDFFKVKNN